MNSLTKQKYLSIKDASELKETLTLISLPKWFWVKSAVHCAKKCLPLVKYQEKLCCLAAIEITEKWLEGKATEEECLKASSSVASLVASSTSSVAASAAAAVAAAAAAAYAAAATAASTSTSAAAYATAAAAYAAYAYGPAASEDPAKLFRGSLSWEDICVVQICNAVGLNPLHYIQETEERVADFLKSETRIWLKTANELLNSDNWDRAEEVFAGLKKFKTIEKLEVE